MFAVGLA